MAGITGVGGKPQVAGGAGTAEQAAAAEARRQAEEARRQAEEAQRKAAEAQRQAEAARRSNDPAVRGKATVLQSTADQLASQGERGAQAARAAMTEANTAATRAGQPPPYPNTVVGTADSFFAGEPAEPGPAVQSELNAQQEFARLSGTQAGRKTLQALGVGNERDLQQFSDQIADGDSAALALLDGLPGERRDLAARAISTLNPEAGDALAQDPSQDEYGLTAEDRTALNAIGLTAEQINQAGDALPDLLAAAKADDPQTALTHLAAAAQQAPALVDAAWAAFTQRPEVQEFFLETLGVELSALPLPSEAVPQVLALIEALRGGEAGAITQAVLELGATLDPAAFEGLLAKLGEALPEDVRDFLGGLAGNEDLQAILSALANDPNLPALMDALQAQDPQALLNVLAQNPALLTALGSAVADLPVVGALFERLGLDPAQLEDLGALLTAVANDPNLPEILSSLSEGEIEEALGLLVQNPDVLTAAGDLLAGLPVVQQLAERLGIDLTALPDLGAVLPELLALSTAIQSGDVATITEALVQVGGLLTGEAFSGMWNKVAGQLPPKVAEFFGDLINNPDLQGALAALAGDPNLGQLAQAVADGDFGQVAALLGANEQFMQHAAHLLLEIGPVHAFLTETLGLTEDQITALSSALPDVIAALGAESPQEAIERLLIAASKIGDAQLAQTLLGRLTQTEAYQSLPQEVRDLIGGLLGDPELQAFAQALVDDPEFSTLVANLAAGELDAVVEQILANDAAVTAGGAALLDIPAVRSFLADKLGIEEDQVKELAAALPALLAALNADTAPEALEHLLAAAGALPEALRATLLGNLGNQISDALGLDPAARDFLHGVLTDARLLEVVEGSGQTLRTVVEQLLAGEVDAALQTLIADPALLGFLGDHLLALPQVKTQLASFLGVTPDELEALGEAASGLLSAYTSLQAEPPDVQGATEHLLAALAGVDPATAQKLFGRLADAVGLDPEIRDAIGAVIADPSVQGLLDDPAFRTAVAQLVSGNGQGALETLLANPATAGKLLAAVGSALGLAPEVVSAIEAALPLIGDPAFAGPLKELLSGIIGGDPQQALAALGALGEAVNALAQSNDPRLIGLFDALGHLPGGIGELFSSPELNAAIVNSGTAGYLFDAARMLADGDLQGAATSLFNAAGALLGSGDGPSINIPGLDLEITQEGAEMFAQLFSNLFNALPNGVKNEIKAKIARALGGTIPILGALITGAMDAKDFYEALQDGDTVDQFVAGTQLLLDGANLVAPGLTGPLKVVLAALQAYRAIDNMKDLVENAGEVFLGIAKDPDEEVFSDEEALVLSYFGGDAERMAQTLSAPPLDALAGDPQAQAAFLEAARAAGIDPAELPAFAQSALVKYQERYGGDASLLSLAQVLAMGRDRNQGDHPMNELDRDAQALLLLRQYFSVEELVAMGGTFPRQWEDLQDEDAYGIPGGFELLKETFPALEDLPSQYVDMVIAMAQSMGVPPDQLVAFTQGLINELGEDGLVMMLGDLVSTHTYKGLGTWWGEDESTFDLVALIQNAVTTQAPGTAAQYPTQP
ncbi:MAG: hypothetical protein M3Y59_17595 [Myxococcota bacterium]|nr:hypothetical protein [Myxococcota bacterium]